LKKFSLAPILCALSFFFLSSCAGYRVSSNFGPRVCYVDALNGEFSSLDECNRSIEKMVEEEEKSYKFKLYASPDNYGPDFGEKLKCVNHPNKAPYYNQIGDEEFETASECLTSDAYKKAKNQYQAKLHAEKAKIRAQIAKAKAQSAQAEEIRISSIKLFVQRSPSSINYQQTVIEMKITRGMPEELLYLSWGRPIKSNNSIGSYGVHKQLVYGPGNYVYVKMALSILIKLLTKIGII
jgi:hypothetical protein